MGKTQGKDVSVILNVIRATASDAYQTAIPLATASNIMDVGSAVLAAPAFVRNEFMANLYNKIGLTLINTPVIENDLAFLKKGILEHGQTIEDIYVGIAEAGEYVTGMQAETDGSFVTPDPFSVRKVEHHSAFYSTILSRQYQVTRHMTDLKKAFHSSNGVEQFVSALMNALTSGENYDDYRMTIALMARQIEEANKVDAGNKHKGVVHLITDFNAKHPAEEQVNATNCFDSQKFLVFFSKELKRWSSRMTKVRTDLNVAGVKQLTSKSSQRVMMLQDIRADFENELFAWAYNSGQFTLGEIDEIDAWYSIGADHASVSTPDKIAVKAQFDNAGGTCAAVIYDPEMIKIYNKERVASDSYNAKGNYWNMFMSLEDIYAVSPFRQFVCFMLD